MKGHAAEEKRLTRTSRDNDQLFLKIAAAACSNTKPQSGDKSKEKEEKRRKQIPVAFSSLTLRCILSGVTQVSANT